LPGWIKGKIRLVPLAAILLVALVGGYLVETGRIRVRNPYYQEQVQAAELMFEAMEVLRKLRLEKGIPMAPTLDPNQTALIGDEFTELTTTTGQLDAKRTATNPDFAALMVKYFQEAGLGPGDYVAVGASGSFPSLLLATLCAARVLDLEPIIIYSVGASMYGANIPGFTFIDMLERLRAEGLLPYEIAAVSMGGIQDRARGLFQDNTELMLAIMEASGADIIIEDSLAESIGRRKEIYREKSGAQGISCFVNVGGASANFGNTEYSLHLPAGLITEFPYAIDHPERGLLFEYGEAGLPVIHLLNVRSLAALNGMPIDPIPLSPPGKSGVYYHQVQPKALIISLLFLILGSMVVAVRKSKI
jgi:poly-gamma-glutamate system protein